MWQAVEFRLFQKSAVKSQSAPAGVFWFRFFKACVYCMFMNNEILVMFVGFVRVLRPLTCREFSTFSVSNCTQIFYTYNLAPPATFSGHGFMRVRICGQIIILNCIVGDDLLCVANISLKAHFSNHCLMNRYRARWALRHLSDRELTCLFKPT